MIPINTYFYTWEESSDYIRKVATQLAPHGVGLQLGMSTDVHTSRLLRSIEGHAAVVANMDGDAVGGMSIMPRLVESAHYPGLSMFTGMLVVPPGMPGVLRDLIMTARSVARDSGADWLVITRSINSTTYKTKAWRV